MGLKYYIILSVIGGCLCVSPDAFGQKIRKETVTVTKKDNTKENKTFAVIYSEGLAKSAQWDMGFTMMRTIPGTAAKATIRHQVSGGNAGNPSVNDRIPLRFIVAPTDIPSGSWTAVTGVNMNNIGDLNADFAVNSALTSGGCVHYGAAGQPGEGRTWRLPTQRELQLMWIFREPIGYIYTNAPMESADTKKYWASTEHGANEAWYFDFKTGSPSCTWQLKNDQKGTAYGRCVSDY